MTATLRLELLREIPSGTGLFLRRVRAVLDTGEAPIVALGAGISTESEVARAKAVSEAVERLTLSSPARSMAKATPITISGTFTRAVIETTERTQPSAAGVTWTASACHFDLETAIRAASTEAVERRHLWQWCAGCELDHALVVHRLHPEELSSPAVAEYLAGFSLEILVSWVAAEVATPAVVVLAIRASENCFYAASAAALTWEEAVEAALLDIAKVLLVEEQFTSSAEAVSFRRPLAEFPHILRRGTSLRDVCLPTPSGRVPMENGSIMSAPWLTPLKRQIVEIALSLERSPPRRLDWFR